jgi:hypothetical protein
MLLTDVAAEVRRVIGSATAAMLSAALSSPNPGDWVAIETGFVGKRSIRVHPGS